MSRLASIFAELRKARRTVLMPFLVAGDPTLETTSTLLRELHRLHVPLCELGFPYSDPIADGPVIQAAYTRALAHHVRVDQILKAVQSIPAEERPVPVGMISMAIIHRWGPASFFRAMADAGFGGLIVPDLPFEEAEAVNALCRAHQLDLIPLITPTTSDVRAEQILQSASGFIYFVSVTGITGERASISDASCQRLRWLRTRTPLPICVGFGVSTPEQVAALSEYADGIIVGSAIVRRIAESTTPEQIVESVTSFVEQLDAPLRGAGSGISAE